jgi:Cu(I)/Ag(I) efflux system membrane fusion protein
VATERETRGGIRVTAIVAAPEQGASEVHVRASGFVERISVEETGVTVSEGQPLLSLYSPEILQAQAELLASRRWSSGDAGGDVTLDAGRRKLALLGMADKDIDRVLSTNEPVRAIPVYAPRGGVVTKKSVVLGSRVTPEMALYELVDLSRVYVTASLFPRDAAQVRTGMEARFTASSQPGAPVTAKIDLVYPGVQPESRTTRVRMVIPNERRRFTPGEYGVVDIATPARRAVFVPRDAVIDTGDHAHVFVVTGPGRFSPRAVATAEIEGDAIAIASGVAAGDRVVSGATFLIDAESRLQGSLAATGSR